MEETKKDAVTLPAGATQSSAGPEQKTSPSPSPKTEVEQKATLAKVKKARVQYRSSPITCGTC